MKKKFIALAVLFVLGLVGSNEVRRIAEEKDRQARIDYFDQEMLPLYREKALLIQSYFKKSSGLVSNPEVSQVLAISQYIPNWNVRTLGDIQEMQELLSYLDQHLGALLQSPQFHGQSDSDFYRKLESLEKEVRSREDGIKLGHRPSSKS